MREDQEREAGTLSRRTFLKTAAVATAAVGALASGCTAAKGSDAAEEAPKGTTFTSYANPDKIGVLQDAKKEETVDFVIVGAGLTGLTAAMITAEQAPKAKILLLDKLATTGGNSNFAEINAPGLTITLPAAQKKAYDNAKASTWIKDPAMLTSLYMDTAKNCAWLLNKHGIKLEQYFYYETRSGAKSMAALTKEIESGSAYSGIEIRLNTQATALLLADDHKCTGVQVLDKSSNTYTNIKAKAVLLATAGLSNNLDLLSYYTNQDVVEKCLSIGAGQDGDGHLLVEKTAHGMCKGIHGAGMFHNVKGFAFDSPLGTAAALQPTNVWVNQRGERFINEQANTYPFIPAGKAIELQGKVFSIFGQNLKKYFETNGSDTRGWFYFKEPMALDADLEKYKDNKNVFKADTLDALAKAIGVPADTLTKTITTYETDAKAGTGDSVLGKPAASMVSIGDGPYYALRIYSGVLQTNGGIRVDPNCRVCDPYFAPIEGLYAGGISVSGFNGEVYSPGTSQAVASWSGSVVARHVVANVLGGTVASDWFGPKEYDGPVGSFPDIMANSPLKPKDATTPK